MRKHIWTAIAGLSLAVTLCACGCHRLPYDEMEESVRESIEATTELPSDNEEQPSTGSDGELYESEENATVEEQQTLDDNTKTESQSENADSETTNDHETGTEKDSSEAAPEMDSLKTFEDPAKPARRGEWQRAYKYNINTKTYEPIAWRIVDVSTNQKEVKEAIEAYEKDHSWISFSDSGEGNEIGEYNIVTYEVYFPETFKPAAWGITSQNIELTVVNPDGSYGFSNGDQPYPGIGTVLDLDYHEGERNSMPGEIYRGKQVFAMLKGETNYLFEYCTKDADEKLLKTYSK